MTIEERAIAYRDDVRNGKHGTNNTITDAYYVGATEQKQIDDREMSDALFIQRQMFFEKAINWIRYYNNNGGCHFDGWENNLIKSMG